MGKGIKMKDLRRFLNDKHSDEIQLNVKTKKLKDDNFEVALSGMVLNKAQLKELGLAEPKPRKKEEEVTPKAPKWFQDFVDGPFKQLNSDMSEVKRRVVKLEVEVGDISERLDKVDKRLSVVEQAVATIQSLDSIKREINSKKRVNELTKK